ncbi:UPF0182 family protein [Agreia sp. COWG]|uniref:UPF0182 family membrane protein n=1 Tax=Agreia sp. COWG TaxID=2773266 RepID=UPI001AFC2227|nr:UPF0182 family protein [Agreia sp. COWG]CAD6001544.1 conserved membrane protein of unknown function [Agreia sp. COWG]
MTSPTAEKPASRRSRAPLAITIAIVVALAIAFFAFSNLYTEVLWYDQLGYVNVLTTQWVAGGVMFFIGFLAMALPVWASIEIAFRWRPVYAKLNSQLDRYQQVVEPLRRLASIGIPVLLGIFAGVATASRWQLTLMWLNRTPTGKTDAQFGLDISFFLYDLPFFRGVVGFASAVILVAGIAALATSYLYGAIRVAGREVRISKTARIQIAVLAALYLAVQAASIWLDQYSTVTNGSGKLITGATYADVNGTIPGLSILAGIAGIVAILFVVAAVIGRWRLPVIGTVLLIVSSLILGSLYPWVVQRFQVDPSERSLESEYIQRNIDSTRDAYGVSGVEETEYDATTDATAGALRSDAVTTANIRIIDPALVSDTYKQLEQFRQYYQFPQYLDVDRYNINGTVQDAVTTVRDLNLEGLGTSNTWYNQHIVYTHGYGLVAAFGNQRSVDGQPVFLESGIPSTGALGNYEPRIYFGESSPDYSIVGGPEGGPKNELDYPSGEEGAQQTYTTFTGDGGPKLDNVFKRLVYALKFQSEQIFLSDGVTDQSQILYDRDPAQRVSKVAPYLTIDSDPYASVVDGKVVWIVDGYTTSENYPYSRTESLSDVIADTYTPKPAFAVDDINYIRNSVKATVDANDGKVTLYAWDETDPLLQTWQKIFPSTLKPMSDMSGDLLSHVRYPADLFKVQRAILGEYHVTDAGSFYSKQDAWTTPNDPTAPSANPTLQPPYYLTLQMPGQEAPSYSLYSTFIPVNTGEGSRNVLNGYLAVDSNAGSEDGKVSSDYGKLRLLTLPKDDTVPGPGQVQNNFTTDPTVSQALNLLRQGETEVKSGNLLTLPVGGGLLYVQPVYVQSTGGTSYPLLQKILVAFGDKIAFEDTLDKALDQLFGGDSGAVAGDESVPVTDQGTSTPAPDSGSGTPSTATPSTSAPSTSTPSADSGSLTQALLDAKSALAERDTALKAGDWQAYGVADAKLKAALEKALAAGGQ